MNKEYGGREVLFLVVTSFLQPCLQIMLIFWIIYARTDQWQYILANCMQKSESAVCLYQMIIVK